MISLLIYSLFYLKLKSTLIEQQKWTPLLWRHVFVQGTKLFSGIQIEYHRTKFLGIFTCSRIGVIKNSNQAKTMKQKYVFKKEKSLYVFQENLVWMPSELKLQSLPAIRQSNLHFITVSISESDFRFWLMFYVR